MLRSACDDPAVDHVSFDRVSNPYLEEMLSLGYSPRHDLDVSFALAEHLPLLFWKLREDLVRSYAWAVPDILALDAVARTVRDVEAIGVVEVAAGNGYWASLLRAGGVDVVATDKEAPGSPWTDVAVMSSSDAAGLFGPDRVLLVCWPPYKDDCALDALAAYEKAGGRAVVYVGEGLGGCTANDAFHDRLDRGWGKAVEVQVPQWPGIHDRLMVYRRRG